MTVVRYSDNSAVHMVGEGGQTQGALPYRPVIVS